MRKFEPLRLEHRALYGRVCGRNENSKFSFAQSYMWQPSYHIGICPHEDGLLFCSHVGEEPPHMVAPLLFDRNRSLRPMFDFMRAVMEGEGLPFEIRYVCPQMRELMERDMPGAFTYEEDPGAGEYIYEQSALATLAGKKLHQKRNLINAFLREHTFSFSEFEPGDLEGCLAVNAAWAEAKGEEDGEETEAIERGFAAWRELELRIGVLRMDGQIAAFSMSEKMAPQAGIEIIEKALPDVKGLFQLINRETAARLFADVERINRCEDMGLEGLRQAKLSYHPLYVLPNYRCRLRAPEA